MILHTQASQDLEWLPSIQVSVSQISFVQGAWWLLQCFFVLKPLFLQVLLVSTSSWLHINLILTFYSVVAGTFTVPDLFIAVPYLCLCLEDLRVRAWVRISLCIPVDVLHGIVHPFPTTNKRILQSGDACCIRND
ncbi:hypothetical protein C8R45DRAFT_1042973 [Mycena sanguinolenta]|nr:hypothetical protein C8R45DRAFT_1042973 [Mycena sanguinolenta]